MTEHPRLILFVEPDGGWAVAMSAGLQVRGWTVAWAADAATAAPAARQTLPDVVVIDAGLADDASRLLQELRAGVTTALIPAVALVEDDAQHARLDAAGAQACLRKPIDVDGLDAAVRDIVTHDVVVSGPPAAVLGDPERLALLRATGLLDEPGDGVFDDVTALAAALLPAQSVRVTLVSDAEQVFKSRTDRGGPAAPERSTPLSHSLCQWPVASREPLVVGDARADPLLALHRAVTELGAVAYLGAPLLVNGHALGTLCVLDDRPREWDPDELALLDDLATATASAVRLRLAAVRGDGEQVSAAADGVAVLARVLQRHGPTLGEAGSRALAGLFAHFARALAPDD
jgi:GAF domain-containing protein